MKFAKKSEVIIVAVILVVAVAYFLINGLISKNALDGEYAEVYYKDKLIDRISLLESDKRNITYKENPLVTINVTGDGGISFAKSDCPDQICVKSGVLRKNGEHASCLPNLFYIKIKSDSGSDGADLVIQ